MLRQCLVVTSSPFIREEQDVLRADVLVQPACGVYGQERPANFQCQSQSWCDTWKPRLRVADQILKRSWRDRGVRPRWILVQEDKLLHVFQKSEASQGQKTRTFGQRK